MKKAIYKITNTRNGKIYIGQSVNPIRRFNAHKNRAKNNVGNSPLYDDIRRYGIESFVLDIIEWTEEYDKREIELIAQYGTMVPNGYNILKGGAEPPHKYGEEHHKSVITEEQVSKIIDALKYSDATETGIGNMFDPPINQCLIHNINHGITHRRDNETYPIRVQSPYHITAKELEEIIWLLKETPYPCVQIAEYYHVNASTVKAINSGGHYYNPNIEYPIRKTRGQKQSQPVETILAKRSTSAIDTQTEMGVCP